MDADRARGIYEKIVRQKRDPALTELVGHGLVRARVFPIEPGQRRRITLRYTQLLERTGESVQFRYSSGTASGGDDVAPVGFTLIADAHAYAEPFSPTHTLDVERREGVLRVTPASGVAGEFSVFLPIAGNAVGITLATHRMGGEDGFFMLTLSPGSGEGGGNPRDITAVVDVSGSMSGAKMEQTRAALHQLLGSLGPDDRFRLVAFSNRVRTSGSGWSSTSPGELRQARDWVEALRADGGTNIAGALEEALRLSSPDDRLPIVVFLTDGLPTVGEQSPERIAEAAESRRGRARIFAFGVGYDVNTYLLDQLGAAGRGSTAYVAPGESVERAVSALTSKITHPVLTDLRIAGAPVRLEEIYPGELPDLFAGEELVIFGRFRDAGEGRLGIRGERGGRSERYGVETAFPARSAANDYIPRLWASRKLGELTRQIRLGGPDPELVESARQTALRYGLLSEYTSYLVLEPGMAAGAPPAPVQVGGESIAVTGAGGRGAGQRAMASRASSGEAAVKASERSHALRAVSSAADLAMAEHEAAQILTRRDVRIVSGRTFGLREGLWMEIGLEPEAGAPAKAEWVIAPFSEAYFAVLEILPELRAVVTEMTPAVVNGATLRIRFQEGGKGKLTRRDLARLASAFRGQ